MDVSTRVLIAIGLVVSAAGIVDAAVSREWDLLVIFALVAAVQLTIWLRQGANRVTVTIRPDLAQWLRHQSELSGESYDDVLDRSIASFRHGLYADERHQS